MKVSKINNGLITIEINQVSHKSSWKVKPLMINMSTQNTHTKGQSIVKPFIFIEIGQKWHRQVKVMG